MLENVEEVGKLHGLARAKAQTYETKTVHPKLVDEYLASGWIVDKQLISKVRIKKDKDQGTLLEDRVWTLLYRMGFSYLCREGGGVLSIDDKDPSGPKSKIDVVGIDTEIAVAFECKSQQELGKRPQFQEELGKHSLMHQAFAKAINDQYPCAFKRQPVIGIFLDNILLSDNDRARAKLANVVIFDSQDLKYYERLVEQVGPAGKYQFFSDMLPYKEISGLRIRVPAVRTKIGGVNFYSFCISPDYLLKISFVSHRTKGKASDVDTYQRMLKKTRLNQIREYISNNGIFPTNIVINLDKTCISFNRMAQESEVEDDEIGTLGWLDIRPTYKSAWIIDGQHRLYAYSGHEYSATSLLPVLAFEGLPPSRQAQLFIDINAKQKRVKQSLLEELYAELHWDADEPKILVRAIISKAIQSLNTDPTSPFYNRIQSADDDDKSPTRCITLTSIFGAIEKTGFHIVKEKHGHAVEYGPLWAGESRETLKRTIFILKNWFNVIRDGAQDWWDKGSGDGGGLAMNDGVIACINVLRSVYQHLDSTGQKLLHLDNQDLAECTRKYGEALANYLGSLSEENKKQFRSLRGIQGQTTRTRRCQQAIRSQFPDFNPPGLDEFLELEKAETNLKAKEIISRIEKRLQSLVMEELRREFGADEAQWWLIGIPKPVRLRVTERFESDDGKRGGKEYYFDLLDYKKIALENFELFEPVLTFEKKGNHDKRLSWLDFINEKRNLLYHSSSGVNVSLDVLDQLQQYDQLLSTKYMSV